MEEKRAGWEGRCFQLSPACLLSPAWRWVGGKLVRTWHMCLQGHGIVWAGRTLAWGGMDL